MSPRFTYLVTVHNKEALLPRVLQGVRQCASPSAKLIIVLDGCTDRSTSIAEKFQDESPIETALVTAPDVHEIKAINYGLREAPTGYCVILQDDVVLQEPNLEKMVHTLCEKRQRRIGFISFRLAADVRCTAFGQRLKLAVRAGSARYVLPIAEDFNLIGGPQEALQVKKVDFGVFYPKTIGIKSPVCLTPELRQKEPFLDESFAPYCYDDFDLSLRALKQNLTNGLFPIRFQSDLEWGSTRTNTDFIYGRGEQIRLRNRRLIWKKHGAFLRQINFATV